MKATAMALGTFCLALVACGGRTPSGGSDGGDAPIQGQGGSGGGANASVPLERDQLVPRLAATFCDGIAPCCQASGFPYDSPSCQKAAMASISTKFVSQTTPSASYDAIAAGRCRDALASVLSVCGDPDQDPVYRACYEIFFGTQPPGAACSTNADCARPDGRRAACSFTVLVSSSGGGAGMGMCVVEQLHAKAGQSCMGICPKGSTSCFDGDATRATCFVDDGLYCSFEGNVGTCKPVANLGEPCRNGGCVDSSVCENGFCRAKRDTGSCTAALDACTDTSYCDTQIVEPANFQCVPKRANGEQCLGPIECLSVYCDMSASVVADAGETPSPGVCAKKTIVSPESCAGIFK
jgi:hypothetical protein